MILRRLLPPVFLFLCLASTAVTGKEGYNVWAKERIRYRYERVQGDPYNAELRVLLANAYFADDDYVDAARQLVRAIELDPDYPEAHCNLATVRRAQGRMREAEAHYRKALLQDSTLVDAMAGLGTLLCTSGRRGEGIEYLERTLAREPHRDEARYNLAVAYHKVRDFRRAIAHLEVLRGHAPEYPGADRALAQACFGRGLTLLQAHLPGEALPFFARSRRLDPGQADVPYAEGLAYLALEDLAKAEAAFRAAVSIDADHVPALHNLGTVLERVGRLDEARDCFERVARLTPHLATIEAARNARYDESVLLEE